MRRIAILAATGRELAPLGAVVRQWGPARRGRVGRYRYDTSQQGPLELYVIKTGVGPRHARDAAAAVISSITPQALISTGYAGALGPDGLGALILGAEVHDWTGERRVPPYLADALLLDTARAGARAAGIGWRQGPLLTVSRIAWRATEKRALGEASGALAVDMESAAIADVAKTAGLPFLTVRAISDKVEEDLPFDFNLWFSPGGSVRVIIETMRRPSMLPRLYRMKQHADAASESLQRFFVAFMDVLASMQGSLQIESSTTVKALF